MGILPQLIKSGAIDSAPKGDDVNGADDQIWNLLCPKSFSKINKQTIKVAIERAYSDVEADRMLADPECFGDVWEEFEVSIQAVTQGHSFEN